MLLLKLRRGSGGTNKRTAWRGLSFYALISKAALSFPPGLRSGPLEGSMCNPYCMANRAIAPSARICMEQFFFIPSYGQQRIAGNVPVG